MGLATLSNDLARATVPTGTTVPRQRKLCEWSMTYAVTSSVDHWKTVSSHHIRCSMTIRDYPMYRNPWYSVQAVACTEIISFPYTSSDLDPPSSKFGLNHPQTAHVRKTVPFRTPAGPAAIRSAFMIEADQTLTAAACPQMTHFGPSRDARIVREQGEDEIVSKAHSRCSSIGRPMEW